MINKVLVTNIRNPFVKNIIKKELNRKMSLYAQRMSLQHKKEP